MFDEKKYENKKEQISVTDFLKLYELTKGFTVYDFDDPVLEQFLEENKKDINKKVF